MYLCGDEDLSLCPHTTLECYMDGPLQDDNQQPTEANTACLYMSVSMYCRQECIETVNSIRSATRQQNNDKPGRSIDQQAYLIIYASDSQSRVPIYNVTSIELAPIGNVTHNATKIQTYAK